MNKIYLTTTLPYVNSKPHIGHALEFIQGDAIARWHRLQGDDIFFNLGLDEHGQKVWNTAQDIGLDVHHYVDSLAKVWENFCTKFEIEYDNFYRTSDPEHYKKTQLFWEKIVDAGDIYKKEYEGLYCVGCESFKAPKDLTIRASDPSWKCRDHPNTKIQTIKEENYFFRLSKYKHHLIQWLKDNPDFLHPKSKREELKNLIEGAEDLSVSRLKKNLPYGIEVPKDDEQVIYVWFEALLNYIFSCDSPERWINSIQICGPDNLRFQAVIWQGILTSGGLPHTKKLLVHGTILDKEGNKMSKSVGNVIDPIDQLDKFGLTAVRYYALVGISTYGNGNWSEEELVELYNSHLADDYGNLISRVLHLVDTLGITTDSNLVDGKFHQEYTNKLQQVYTNWLDYEIKDVATTLNAIVKDANKYISDKEPWKTKDPTVLNNLYWVLRRLTSFYIPFIPEKKLEIKTALDKRKKAIIFPKIIF